MAEVYKTLGQSAPSAVTAIALYTVPGSTSTVVSTVTVCNRGNSATTFRISIRVNGEGDDPKQYIYYDVPIPANDTFAATIGVTLATADALWIYAGNGDLSFQAWGTEVS
jgi:hypothetical protein